MKKTLFLIPMFAIAMLTGCVQKGGDGRSSQSTPSGSSSQGGGGGGESLEGYYSSITSDMSGDTLLSKLNQLNSAKRKKTIGYDGMRSKFQYVDTCPEANGKIVGFYNNDLIGPSWDSGKTWNREHVWPNSKGAGDKGTLASPWIEADIHMVRPTSKSINEDRGNDYYSKNKYDPGQFIAEYRGIAARIIFYCAIADTRLKIIDSDTGSSPNMGKLSDLLEWNLQYLPNTSSSASLAYKVEQYRNEAIYSRSDMQGNRNPFIDHPEFACKIWGNTNFTTKSICQGHM